jgi:hypothetical protein
MTAAIGIFTFGSFAVVGSISMTPMAPALLR